MTSFAPAVALPPGQYIKETLDALGWTQGDLAQVMGRSEKEIGSLISAKMGVTMRTAKELEAALGIDAEIWVRMESLYRLHTCKPASEDIARRRAIRARTPLRHLIKREWIDPTDDVDELENRVVTFLGVEHLEQRQPLNVAAKRTDHESDLTPEQEAWLLRVKRIAETMPCKRYSEERLRNSLADLQSLLSAPDEARHVPDIMASTGVRFVVVERLPGLKIDGVCFWLDDDSPVIGMSLRHDRIDNFWFVLRHEIEHTLNGDRPVLDTDLEKDKGSVTVEEARANAAAAEFCVPQEELEDFIIRVGPLYTYDRIKRFAWSLGIHPGLVAGQLRRRFEQWNKYTRVIDKIRHHLIATATVDGFGGVLPT